MSDDEELEARLARWQHADPPLDLLRRLRMAEPAARSGYIWPKFSWLWPLLSAGLFIAVTLVFVRWQPPSAQPPPVRTIGVAQSNWASARRSEKIDVRTAANPGSAVFSWMNDTSGHGESFRGGEALLNGSTNIRLGCVFQLERPTGPIQLGWNRSPLDHDFMGLPFNKLPFDISDPF